MKYHKIQTVFKRGKKKELIEGQFSEPAFETLQSINWTFTEKVDGRNTRIIYNGDSGNITFDGKTDNSDIPAKVLNNVLLPILDKRPLFIDTFGNKDVNFIGEGYGAGTSKVGKLYRKDQGFVLFDIWINSKSEDQKVQGVFLERDALSKIAQNFELEIIPIIGEGTLSDMVEMTRRGFNSKWGDFKAEGIVARPETELLTKTGDRIITKIKHKDFK